MRSISPRRSSSSNSWLFAAAASVVLGFGAAASFADVTGTAKLDGKAPEAKTIDMSGVKECNDLHPDPVAEETIVASDKGELKNVVISIKQEGLTGDVPKEPAVIDQVGCQYHPHVLAMMTGQDLLVKNSDPFLHNIHSLSQVNPAFNKAQPNKNDGEKMEAPKAPETYHVKCDVHPWMSCYVAVFDNPFFAVTDDSGKFAIKNLPDGEYTLHAWHEKLGEQDQQIKVAGGKADKDIVFTFKPEAAQAPAVNETGVRLASDVKESTECKNGGACCGGDVSKAAKIAAAGEADKQTAQASQPKVADAKN